ncbi:hypothetical protein LCGC14_2508150, partial [marine sediment metagenome]
MWTASRGGVWRCLMSVKVRFCKVLEKLKEKEMQDFIEAVELFEYSKAAESLESLAAM